MRKEFASEKRGTKCSGHIFMAGMQGSALGILEDQVVKAAKGKFWKLFNLDLIGKRE